MTTADAERMSMICNVSVQQAEKWIAMSRFAWLDEISEEDAEAIVFAGITDLESLAETGAEDLFKRVKDAITSGNVRVPAEHKINLEKVKNWIDAAKKMA